MTLDEHIEDIRAGKLGVVARDQSKSRSNHAYR
jgi:hypothetical protein